MRLTAFLEQWGATAPAPLLAGLHVLAAALLLFVAAAWARHGRRWVLVTSAVVTVTVITLVYFMMVQPSDIPTEWITVLTRGFERKSIMHLYTRGAHAGSNFDFVPLAIAAGPAPTLYDVVWFNLLLALINAAIFLHLALHVVNPVWAFVWTLVFAMNPVTFLASFSELPTNLLALYFLAGVLAWSVLNDAQPQPRTIRAAAAGLCALLTLLAALTRIEVSLIGVTALVLHAGDVLLGTDLWPSLWRRVRTACERPLAFLADHPGVVVVLCLIAWQGPWVMGREEVAALYPFNASILGLFVFLPMLGLPIGVSVATLFGFVRSIVGFREFGGLALSLFVLVRGYFGIYDSYFEMGRFSSYVLPAVFCMALFGQGQFDAMIQVWRANWQRLARVVYIMSWLTLPLPGVLEFYLRSEYTEYTGFRAGVSQLLLDRNTQREVRHLLTLTAQNPQCVFVGRVIRDEGDFRINPQYEYVLFGAPIAEPIFVPEKEAALDEVIGRYASGASCVRLHYGGDCNVRLGDRCKEFVAGRRLLDEERFWSRPYNSNPWDSGAPEIILATYAWP
jgi:hypothetical protein